MKTLKVDSLLIRIFAECIIVATLLTFLGKTLAVYIHNIPVARFRELAATLLPQNIVFLHPERDERIIFIILTLSVPVLCAIVYYFMNTFKADAEIPQVRWKQLILVLPFVILFVAGCCSLYSARLGELFFDPIKKSIFWIIFSLFIAGIWLFFERREKFSNCLPRWLLAVIIIGLPVLQVFCSRFYTLRDLHLAYTHHLEVVTYAIAQAAAGRVDIDQYGFYPQLIAPLFQLTGTSIFNISVVMGILYVLVFLGIIDICGKFIRSRTLLAGLAVVLFLTNNTWGLLNDNRMEPIFAYYPVRMIFPVLSMLLFYKWITCGQNCKLIIIAGAICGTGLMWNPESGIPGTAAFMFYLLILWAQKRSRRELLLIIAFAGAMVAAVLLEYLLLSLKNGALIDLTRMTKFPQIFYESGFMMLRLPDTLHPWLIVAGIYLLAFVTGLRCCLSSQNTTLNKMLLFLAVTGVGLFTYYQGRSCDFNLTCVMWPAVMISFILCDRLFRCYRAGMLSPVLLFPAFPVLLIVILSIATIAIKVDKIQAGLNSAWLGLRDFNELNPTESNTRFILSCAGIRREVNIFGDRQGIYYAETGLRSAVADFNLIELMLIDDQQRIFATLARSTTPLIVLTLPGNKPGLPDAVLQNYRLMAVNETKTIYYYEPLGR